MKTRNIFIIFIIVLILGVSAVTSMVFLDGITFSDIARGDMSLGNISDNFIFMNRYSEEIYRDEKVAGINKIESENLSLIFTIEEGNEGMRVHSNRKVDFNKYIEYSIEGDTLKIEDTGKDLPFGTELAIEISVKDAEKLDIDVNDLDGIVTIDDTIGSLKVENLDGIFTSDTDDTYDIEISNAEGIVTINADDFNTELRVNESSGIVTVAGHEFDPFNDSDSINMTCGEGEKTINIDSASGIITIGE